MDYKNQFQFLKQLSKALAEQFGSQCEVVVHDLTQGSENTIIAIENGHITGRNIGDNASGIVVRVLHDPDMATDRIGYLTRTQDGRLLHSSSIYLKDEDGYPIALLGINYDFTEISHATNILKQFIGVHKKEDRSDNIETIFSSVNDMLDQLIAESADYIGKPVALMNKEDKVQAIRYLDERGVFSIMKSGDKVSQFYGISKYTLYNYLNEIGEKKGDCE